MLVLSNLPKKDNQYYLLKWIGQIGKHSSKEDDFSIKLMFSPFKLGNKNLNELKDGNKSFNYLIDSDLLVIESSFGLLPFLPLGSIWKNQKRVTAISKLDTISQHFYFEKERYSNISPDASNSIDYDNPDNDKRIIQANIWNITYPNTSKAGLLCDLMKIKYDNVELLIPHYEILRTFYCNSTRLSLAFINGLYEYNEDYLYDVKESKLNTATKHGFLILCKNTLNTDMKTLAEFAFNKTFKRRAMNHRRMLSKHIITDSWLDSVKTKPLDIKLPVNGNYNINANGLWLNSSDKGIRRFLVLNILNIDYWCPFEELSYLRKNRNFKTGNPKEKTPAWVGTRIKEINTDGLTKEEMFIIESMDPGNAVLVNSLLGATAIKNSLDIILPNRIETDAEYTKLKEQTTNYIDPTVSSTGEGRNSNEGIGNLNIESGINYSEERATLPNKFKCLIETCNIVIEALSEEFKNIEHHRSHNEHSESRYFFAPNMPLKGRKIPCKWPYLSWEKKSKRIFYIRTIIIEGSFYLYLLEIEPRIDDEGAEERKLPCFIFNNINGERIPTSEKIDLVKALTKKKAYGDKGCWWKYVSNVVFLKKRELRHKYKSRRNGVPFYLTVRESNSKLATKIIDYINKSPKF